MTHSEKLRLGGMALRNGLLVHGPTHWAAAVRAPDGAIRVASGPKPRTRRLDGIPGVRGLARLGEAFAVIPLVKRALPEARLPFQDASVVAVAAAVEVFAWAERHGDTRAARAIRRPGFELQRAMGTREPDERQLEVGRAALEEIVRVEGAA